MSSSSELQEKLALSKKFRSLKVMQRLFENSTQLEEYLARHIQTHWNTPNNDHSPTDAENKLESYLIEAVSNSTRFRDLRPGDANLTATIEDNFFYQHMFNFALVIILLMQVIVVWAFIWCRLSKYGNEPINSPDIEDEIALRNVAQLPEVIPLHGERGGDDGDSENEGGGQAFLANRCGRYG